VNCMLIIVQNFEGNFQRLSTKLKDHENLFKMNKIKNIFRNVGKVFV